MGGPPAAAAIASSTRGNHADSAGACRAVEAVCDGWTWSFGQWYFSIFFFIATR